MTRKLSSSQEKGDLNVSQRATIEAAWKTSSMSLGILDTSSQYWRLPLLISNHPRSRLGKWLWSKSFRSKASCCMVKSEGSPDSSQRLSTSRCTDSKSYWPRLTMMRLTSHLWKYVSYSYRLKVVLQLKNSLVSVLSASRHLLLIWEFQLKFRCKSSETR